ncbi:MAG: hypothetical protein CL678_16900 [Bdellovibrionaceae bacterium]|nr:hypothetical protein [Pseudobdellovibrionaceae bacterium]
MILVIRYFTGIQLPLFGSNLRSLKEAVEIVGVELWAFLRVRTHLNFNVESITQLLLSPVLKNSILKKEGKLISFNIKMVAMDRSSFFIWK